MWDATTKVMIQRATKLTIETQARIWKAKESMLFMRTFNCLQQIGDTMEEKEKKKKNSARGGDEDREEEEGVEHVLPCVAWWSGCLHSREITELVSLADETLLSCHDDSTGCSSFQRWSTEGPPLLTFGKDDINDVRGVVLLNNRTIASCGLDANIHIWDLETGELLQTLSGGAALCCLTRLLFKRNDDEHDDSSDVVGTDCYSLVAGDITGRLRVWHPVAVPSTQQQQQQCLYQEPCLTLKEDSPSSSSTTAEEGEERESIITVCGLSDGETVVSGTSRGVVHVWNLSRHNQLTPRITRSLPSPKFKAVRHLVEAWKTTNQQLGASIVIACAYDNGMIRLWNGTTGDVVRDINASSPLPVRRLLKLKSSFGLNGLLCSLSWDYTISIWDLRSGERRASAKMEFLGFSLTELGVGNIAVGDEMGNIQVLSYPIT